MSSQAEDRTLEGSTHTSASCWLGECWLPFSEPLSFQNRSEQAGNTCFCLEHTRFHFDDLAAMTDFTRRDRRGSLIGDLNVNWDPSGLSKEGNKGKCQRM